VRGALASQQQPHRFMEMLVMPLCFRQHLLAHQQEPLLQLAVAAAVLAQLMPLKMEALEVVDLGVLEAIRAVLEHPAKATRVEMALLLLNLARAAVAVQALSV